MSIKSHSFSIVVETENLGMAQIDDLRASLDSLKKQTLPITKAKEIIIVVGSHVSADVQKILKKDYPWITLHKAKGDINYTGAKYLGAKHATSEFVVFVDSDVRYPVTWLASLLDVFITHKDASVSTSDTRVEINSSYALALNLTWTIDVRPQIEEISKFYTFNLNNFAIRRSVMLSHPFPDLALYRGHISMWRKMLSADGHVFYRVPNMVCYHAPPGNLKDYTLRMIIYGADFVSSADYSLKGKVVTHDPSLLRRLGNVTLWALMKIKQFSLHTYRLLGEDLTHLRYYPLAILISIFGLTLTMIGALTSLVSPNFWYQKITAYEAGND